MLTTAIPPRTRFLGLLNNAGHAPIFGVLALIVLKLAGGWRTAPVPSSWRYVGAFGVTVCLGAAVEAVQSLIGRDAAWVDLGMDAAGAAVALGIAAALAAGRSRPVVCGSGLAVAAVGAAVVLAPLVEAGLAYQRRADSFPVIAGFETARDLYFIEGSGAELARVALPEPWARGEPSTALELRFTRVDNPGVRHNEPAPDWSGYQRIKLDLTNPGDTKLSFILRVHDVHHDQRHADRFNYYFNLGPRMRRVVDIPLKLVADAPRNRAMDMRHIAGIVLFEHSRPAPVGASFYVTRIWLE